MKCDVLIAPARNAIVLVWDFYTNQHKLHQIVVQHILLAHLHPPYIRHLLLPTRKEFLKVLVVIQILFLTKAYHSGHLQIFMMERFCKNFLLLDDGGPYHIEISPLIDCFYLTGNERVKVFVI